MEQQICPGCVHAREIGNPVIMKLIRYEALIESGCPVGRHELTNDEWLQLGLIRAERQKIATEKKVKTNHESGATRPWQ